MGQKDGIVARLHNDDKFICDVSISPQSNQIPFVSGEDLRISSFSIASDRCSPLVVLHTIASEGVSFKLEPLENYNGLNEFALIHSACLKELKVKSLCSNNH